MRILKNKSFVLTLNIKENQGIIMQYFNYAYNKGWSNIDLDM